MSSDSIDNLMHEERRFPPPEGFADLSPRELDVLEDLVTRITARSEPAS